MHGVLLLEAVGIRDAPGGELSLEMFREEILCVAVAWQRWEDVFKRLPERKLGVVAEQGVVRGHACG